MWNSVAQGPAGRLWYQRPHGDIVARMGRSLLIVASGILLGLAIVWLVMSQVSDGNQGSIQPANTPYGGARPIQEPRADPQHPVR